MSLLCQLPVYGQEHTNTLSVIAEKPTEERWYGIIKTPRQWLRTVFELKFSADGKCTGHAISLDQASAKIPVTTGTRIDDKWTLEFKGVNATFKGAQSKDGKSVDGVFAQGVDLPLRLERVEKTPTMEGSKVMRGELNALVQKLQMQVRFIENEKVDGKQLVLVDSLSQKAGSFVGTYEETEEQRIITVPVLSASWKCQKKKDDKPDASKPDATEWAGSWSQGLIPLSLNLKVEPSALDYAAFEKARPQTPKAPFPYEIREVGWKNEAAEGVQLAGTLLIPPADQLRAAVVLLTGSGPQDRDESLADHKPFLVIADHLARRGIAVLRFDDRGVGSSTGSFATAVTDDFTSDALSAWQFLSKQVDLKPSKIGMLGHSEGSAIALESAAKNSEIGFLVLMAGAGWDGRRIVIEQSALIAQRQGDSTPKSLSALRRLLEKHSDLVVAQPSAEVLKKSIEEMIDEFVESAEVPKEDIELTRSSLIGRFTQLDGAWYRDFLVRDPSRLLSKLSQPILALWGELDLQVPAKGNRDSMEAAMKSGKPNPLNSLEILPNTNHLLQPCKTGLPDEYETIETTIRPEALEKFASFILSAAN